MTKKRSSKIDSKRLSSKIKPDTSGAGSPKQGTAASKQAAPKEKSTTNADTNTPTDQQPQADRLKKGTQAKLSDTTKAVNESSSREAGEGKRFDLADKARDECEQLLIDKGAAERIEVKEDSKTNEKEKEKGQRDSSPEQDKPIVKRNAKGQLMEPPPWLNRGGRSMGQTNLTSRMRRIVTKKNPRYLTGLFRLADREYKDRIKASKRIEQVLDKAGELTTDELKKLLTVTMPGLEATKVVAGLVGKFIPRQLDVQASGTTKHMELILGLTGDDAVEFLSGDKDLTQIAQEKGVDLEQ